MSSLVAIDVNITAGTALSNSGLDREVALSEKQVSNKFELYYSCSAIGDNNNNDGNKIEIIFYDEELHMYDASNIFIPILEEGLKNYQIDIPKDTHKIELSFWGDYTIDYFQMYSVFNTSSVEIATETVKGIANFPDTNFVVADGAISLSSRLTLNTPLDGTDKRGVSEITAEQGVLTIKKWNTNNDSFEGLRLGNGVEQYDPLTDTWKSLGTSIIGGTGMVVAHADTTSLTNADLTGSNCLHVGYSTTGDKIVGDNSTIYTNGLVLLGYEVVTKELPDEKVKHYLFNGDINYVDFSSTCFGHGSSGSFGQSSLGYTSTTSTTLESWNMLYTTNKIDLTNIKTIYMNAQFLNSSNTSQNGVRIEIRTVEPSRDTVQSGRVAIETILDSGLCTLDASSLSGEYFVCVGQYIQSTSSGTSSSASAILENLYYEEMT